jgi:hypothetical protein
MFIDKIDGVSMLFHETLGEVSATSPKNYGLINFKETTRIIIETGQDNSMTSQWKDCPSLWAVENVLLKIYKFPFYWIL